MNTVRGTRILAAAGAALLLCAFGCASTGGAGSGGTAAAFVAPDGAHATPNTGASRLADGMPVAPAPTLAAAAAAPGKSPASTADGTTFTWTGGGSAVSVAGEFNNWDVAADPMVKQADGSFRLVKKLNPGRYAYKFVVDGQWKPDPGAKETVDDSFGGKNSLVVVGGTAAPAPAATPAAAATAAPTASADGATFKWTGGGAAVTVAGEFNNWDMAADPMVKQADGSFTLVKKLEPGRHAYKFVVDGQWKPDPAATETVDDSFGGKNSVIVVGGGAGAAAPAAGTAAAPATGTPGKVGVGRPPEVTADGVRFTFGGAARTVALAGDFNAWAPAVDPMTQGADGAWTIVKKLPAGSHAYKFIVDGTTWKLDEANPASVDDGFGGKNSVVVVP